jgi:hypothetical protein
MSDVYTNASDHHHNNIVIKRQCKPPCTLKLNFVNVRDAKRVAKFPAQRQGGEGGARARKQRKKSSVPSWKKTKAKETGENKGGGLGVTISRITLVPVWTWYFLPDSLVGYWIGPLVEV